MGLIFLWRRSSASTDLNVLFKWMRDAPDLCMDRLFWVGCMFYVVIQNTHIIAGDTLITHISLSTLYTKLFYKKNFLLETFLSNLAFKFNFKNVC